MSLIEYFSYFHLSIHIPGIYAYITLKEHDITESVEEIEADMRKMVRNHIAAYAVPDMMQVGPRVGWPVYSK